MMGMFGNQPSMYPAMMANMGSQGASEYKPIPGQPGYFTNPDGHRYKRERPNYYKPADPLPQPPPNQFVLPNPLYNKPGLIPQDVLEPLQDAYPELDFSKPNLYERPLPYPFTTGAAGSWVENNPFTAINLSNMTGIGQSDMNENEKLIMGWLDTEQGQMFMEMYQDALDDK